MLNAVLVVIALLLDPYIYLLLLRLLLQKYRAPYQNPISQMVIRLTEPVIKPVRRVIPGYQGFDLAIVFWLLVLQVLSFTLSLWVNAGAMPHLFGVLVMAAGEVADKWLALIVIVIIINVLMSWFPSLQNSPVSPITQCLCAPWLGFVQRFIPLIAGLDFSPLFVILGIKLISIFVLQPVINMGFRLAVAI